MLKAFLYYNFSHSISSMIPTTIGLVIFNLYEHYNGRALKVSQIYELVTLFNGVLMPIRFYIMGMMGKAEALAACERIRTVTKIEPFQPLKDDPALSKGDLEIKNGSFNWEDEQYHKIFEGKEMSEDKKKAMILKDVDLSIKQGEFVAVIGTVGAGKSSLIYAMMNEMVKHKGVVRKNGKMALISQETFLQNDTIRNNITFGMPYDQHKFEHILDICQMKPDMAMLPGREMTEIGERGVNMSGGQKQRINIARGVYSEADIYLIDDALSALDAYVGKKVMDKVFKEKLAGKTRIMVTHYLHLLEEVDKVILIDKGEIKAFGTFEEVRETPYFKDFASSTGKKNIEEVEEKEEEGMEEKQEEELSKVEEQEETVNEKVENENDKAVDKKNAGKLTEEEKRDTGMAGLSYYVYYARSAGCMLSICCCLFYAFSIVFTMGCDWWVGQWAEDAYKLDRDTYVLVYFFLAIVLASLLIFRAYTLSYVAKLASMNIFSSILWNILRRPMSYFDTTPSGIIINRCTGDVDDVDYTIPWFLGFFMNIGFNFMGVMFLTAMISPLVILIMLIGFLVIVSSFRKYLKTAIEIKRLIQISNSPIVSMTKELIEGSTVIRAYGKGNDVLSKFGEKSDLYQKSYMHECRVNLWMRAKIEYTLAFIISFTVISVIINTERQ
jgi:ABC-type multidrug transport system fused ATPase/permease subunit